MCMGDVHGVWGACLCADCVCVWVHGHEMLRAPRVGMALVALLALCVGYGGGCCAARMHSSGDPART
jgi:hypothetical protein